MTIGLIESVILLALNIYHEAQGESELGQKAVTKVVLNRTHKDQETIQEVIYKHAQFSWTEDDRPDAPENIPIFVKCGEVALEAMLEYANGDTLDGANLYYNPKVVTPDWNFKKTADELGVHKSTLYRKVERFGIRHSGK